ncbi:MAG: histidinol-phosphate transaminase [Nitrospirota bacterium]
MKLNIALTKLPAYVPGKPIETLEREMGIVGAIKLASNENPLGASPRAVAAMKAGLRGMTRYPDGNASLLKEALARKWNVKESQVIIGNGSDEVISLLTRALLLPGDEAIMANPSFVIYRLSVLACYAKPIEIPLKAGRHDLLRMAEAVTKKTRIIFICNPNNPTGTIVNRLEVKRFLSSLSKEILVVFDEAYAEYVTDVDYPRSDLLLRSGRSEKGGASVIFLRTFSKIYGLAGIRVGYGIGPENLADLLNRLRLPFNVNLLGQQAALAALSDEAHIKKSLTVNEEGKTYLYEQFNKMGISFFPTEANFIYFNIAMKNKGSGSPFDQLLMKGVIVRHLGQDALRVTIGKMSENKRFIRALSEVLAR